MRAKKSGSRDPKYFGSIHVSTRIYRALKRMGYSDPTPIQIESIPKLSLGSDIVGKAQTGTGKTTAFSIPLIQKIDPTKTTTQGIVLVPTRELAVQVTGEIKKLSQFLPIRTTTLYGGQPIIKQVEELKKTPHIIVGTPGRILDHLRRNTLRLDRITFAILDEADQMLDIGFSDDMIKILSLTPRNRQTALFSATIPPTIKRLINRFLRNPQYIDVGNGIEAADTVKQMYYEVAEQDKFKGLTEILSSDADARKTLIFCRTQIGVDILARRLSKENFNANAIHGGLSQIQRDKVISSYRLGKSQILVATNVAARGLDIPDIGYVINYNMPGNIEEYIHRIGRTGRIGNLGTSITFVGEDDFELMDLIKKKFEANIEKGRLLLYQN